MTQPHIEEAVKRHEKLAEEEPDPDDWDDLGYESKEGFEERLHELDKLPESMTVPAPISFTKEKRGNTTLEWGWRGDNVVIHLSWARPPTIPTSVITESIVAALHAVLNDTVHAKVKKPVAPINQTGKTVTGTILDGNYTIILAMLKLRPGSSHFLREKIIPALLDVDAIGLKGLRRIPEHMKTRGGPRPRL